MLKLLVNDPLLWEAFVKELEDRIDNHHKTIEQLTDLNAILREQGSISALRKLLQLRDKLNVKN